MSIINSHALLLNAAFEFPGGIQTEAYLDDYGNPTGPGGIMTKRDGTPVKMGDIWESEHEALLDYAQTLDEYAEHVLSVATRPPNENQLGAMTLLCWNIGKSAFSGSTVLAKHNEGRFEEAAAAFGKWVYATKHPSPYVDGPDGEPLDKPWLQAARGLLRRHYAEACLYLGYDWKEATQNDRIELRVRATDFDRHQGRWEDDIGHKTPWAEVLAIAEQYPLTLEPVEVDPIPDLPSRQTSEPPPPVPDPEPVPMTSPPVRAPANTQPSYTLKDDFDPNAGFKNMIASRRFWGWMLIIVGRVSFLSTGAATASSGLPVIGPIAQAIAADPVLFDMWTGVGVMVAGEALKWWGERKATRPVV